MIRNIVSEREREREGERVGKRGRKREKVRGNIKHVFCQNFFFIGTGTHTTVSALCSGFLFSFLFLSIAYRIDLTSKKAFQ